MKLAIDLLLLYPVSHVSKKVVFIRASSSKPSAWTSESQSVLRNPTLEGDVSASVYL